mmetsp:Transcript_401/g.1112  ORF Transcript_401/g.1112 Transcript_401/m.1112 type:complete len:402 (-) Transcript_401:178-1383(-)
MGYERYLTSEDTLPCRSVVPGAGQAGWAPTVPWALLLASLFPLSSGFFCSWTSDDSTKWLPIGWRDGLRSLHDLARCEGHNRAVRPLRGSIAELLEVLELEDDGTDKAVDRQRLKRSYRDLSVRHHPDKTQESSRFQEIRKAFEILDDPVKVLLYDTGGLDLVQKYEAESDEIPVTENLEVSHKMSLEEAYSGGTYMLGLRKQVVCLSCRQQPRLPRCRGCNRCPNELRLREVWVSQFEYYVEEIRVPSPEMCQEADLSLDMTIERGVMTGEKLRFDSMAAQLPQHVPGDVLVTVEVLPHRHFKRSGANLLLHLQISLLEALTGFEREVLHLDGHIIHISVPRGTVVHPGTALEIQGEGMPAHDDPSHFGNLLLHFDIGFPDLDDAACQALEGAFALLAPS